MIDRVLVASVTKENIKQQRKQNFNTLFYFIIYIIISILLSIFMLKSEHKITLIVLLSILLVIISVVLYISDKQYQILLGETDESIIGVSGIFDMWSDFLSGDTDVVPKLPCMVC
tara:strand:+ start:744 stop:1088 length:345 start_codon:yes stop_codon:yes gene_type:complete